MRVLTVAFLDEGDSYDEKHEKLATLLYKVRINAEVVVVEANIEFDPVTPLTKMNWESLLGRLNIENSLEVTQRSKRYLVFADLVRQYSSHASFVVQTIDIPPADEATNLYMAWLETMSNISVPFCFIRGNGDTVLACSV